MYDDGFLPPDDWTEEDRNECVSPERDREPLTDEEIDAMTPEYPGKKAWPF